MELRPYQTEAVRNLRRSIATGHRSPLFVLPTGGGKTAVAVTMIENATRKGKSVLFLAPRRELIYQTDARLEGIEHGIIMAGERPSIIPQVQVACIPTLHARAVQRENIRLPRADLVLVDEAHIGIGGRAQDMIDHYREEGSVVVGLTATPARTDGRGLGAIYDDMVMGPSVAELTRDGFLVPARYFSGPEPDLKGVKIQAGDYQQKQLGERVDQPKLVGDVVSNWARIAGDRQTFVYAVNIAHSMHLCEQFRSVGIRAEHLDGNTDLDERKAIQQRLRDGTTQVLVNCQVLTYGVDFPPVSCIVLAAPTKSITKYFQQVGRGLRPHPGKDDCIVICHSSAVDDLGFVDDEMPWSLDGDTKVQDRKAAKAKEPKSIECPECHTVFRAARNCPNCGHAMGERYAKAIAVEDADLQELDKNKRRLNREWSKPQKRRFFGELKQIARERGYAPGWAAHKYRQRLSVWPNVVKDAPAMEPSPETLAWVKHTMIRYAKRREVA